MPINALLNAYHTITNVVAGFFAEVDWNVTRAIWRLTAILTALLILGKSAVADPLDSNNQTTALLRDHLFQFSTWEANAFLDKARAELSGIHTYLDEAQREQFVRDYISAVNELARLEDQVTRTYSDPSITDPAAASASLRTERDALRAQQARQQPIAEAIIESQIATSLTRLGFGIGGHIGPPVRLRFTQPPSLMVVSPRDYIERTGSYPLQHDLTVDDKETLEASLDSTLDVSSLSVPLGGLAVYPAMLIETGYAPGIFDLGAHEWAHHYLSFYPLGFNFGASPDLFTMNETVASIIGQEVGRAVLQQHYPDLAPPPPAAPATAPAPRSQPPAFDFQAEMRLTRVQVDTLLTEGRIEQAESYMEERRKVFVENGYNIRKINQAYFAFYGSYADTPGARGEDPIGPMILEIRDLSPSLLDFVTTIRSITTFEELERVLAELRANTS